jgi:opacity protein-like surface antigen
MKGLLIGTAISLVAAASAGAADLYIKAPAYVPWTGFYLGGGGSYSWGRVPDTGTYYPGFSDTTIDAVTTRAINHTIRGIDGEIQGGYRRQIGTLVVGLEGVARLTDESGSGSCNETYTPTNPYPDLASKFGTFTCYKGTRLNSTEAVLLQAGVLVTPTTLVFLSGGPGVGQIHTNDAFAFAYTYPTPGLTTAGSSSATTNKAGYWLGGGVEYAIPGTKVHLKAEYYHMDFGNVNTTTSWTDTTANCAAVTSPNACVNTFMNGRHVTDDSVLLGINYTFN